MIRTFFTDMRATLTPAGALEFLVLFMFVWFGLPALLGHLAEQINAVRRRAAGEPEPEGGYQLALPPVTWLPILAALGGWTWWLFRFVYANRRAVFDWVSVVDLGAW
jgi:hypothetical protein